ncbi:MAG: formylglycine-generating enzyme family protein [Chloroflexi bacterium]|nr:formylglycine-generating enzyme family protein [Chloroflexota bacterium]
MKNLVYILITFVFSLVVGCRGNGATVTPLPTTAITLEPVAPRTRSTDGMTMVYVWGGAFQMGNTERYRNEKPVHTVILDSFWIDKYEVTNEQFTRFVQTTDYMTDAERKETGRVYTKKSGWDNVVGADWQHPGGPETGIADIMDHPVVQVSWNDAQAYCEWAGARLPTEAEWAYAARGPTGNVYPWGDEFDCSVGNFDDETEIDENVVWGTEGCDGYVMTAPVGRFRRGASWCEALDMAGNVREWVSDWYDEYPSATQTNPTGPETGDEKALRGGAWHSAPFAVHAAVRGAGAPARSTFILGFRCVVEPGE